jgi:hypothetical protein
MSKYDVHDGYGNKMGTIDTEDPIDQAVGMAVFLGLFGKPIIIIAVVLSVIMAPFLFVQWIRGVVASAKDPKVESQYEAELTALMPLALSQSTNSLNTLTITPRLTQVFTSQALNDIRQQLTDLKNGNEVVTQEVSLTWIGKPRWLESCRGGDAELVANATCACARVEVSGSITKSSPKGVQTTPLDKHAVFGFVRTADRWWVAEMLGDFAINLRSGAVLSSYCN